MIEMLLAINQPQRQQAGQSLGNQRRIPDAVHAEHCGQEENAGRLKHQRARERDDRGNQAVVQRGEEAGGEDIEAGKQEGEGEDRERMARQVKQPFVVADKDFRQRRVSATPVIPISVRLFFSMFFNSSW